MQVQRQKCRSPSPSGGCRGYVVCYALAAYAYCSCQLSREPPPYFKFQNGNGLGEGGVGVRVNGAEPKPSTATSSPRALSSCSWSAGGWDAWRAPAPTDRGAVWRCAKLRMRTRAIKSPSALCACPDTHAKYHAPSASETADHAPETREIKSGSNVAERHRSRARACRAHTGHSFAPTRLTRRARGRSSPAPLRRPYRPPRRARPSACRPCSGGVCSGLGRASSAPCWARGSP